ncbi:unnamed protein product [Ectocarpus sp. 4 AP-2014]
MCRVALEGINATSIRSTPRGPPCSIDHQSDPNVKWAARTLRRAAAVLRSMPAAAVACRSGVFTCLPARAYSKSLVSPRLWSCQACSHRIQRNPLPVRRCRQRWRKRHGREGSGEGTAAGGSTVTATYQRRRRRCPSRGEVQPTATPCSFSRHSRPAALPGY